MAEVILKPKGNFDIMVEAEVITPNNFAKKTAKDIANLIVWQGPSEYALSNFFEIEGNGGNSAADTTIIIEGDIPRVKRIGQEMSDGKIIINGWAGMHVGSGMSGGEIIVEGDCEAWAGMEMKGGLLHIKGNTKDHLGCAYRGSWHGMSGGRIIVDGNALSQAGGGISGGEIIVNGNVENFCGIRANGGLIVVKGNALRTVGAEMTNGTIVIAGHITKFTPGFQFEAIENNLKFADIELPDGEYKKYTGDYAIPQKVKGVLYVSSKCNGGI